MRIYGKFIEEWLEKEDAAYHFIPIEGQTRINVKLKGKMKQRLTEEAQLFPRKKAAINKQIDQLTSEDTLVISGSKNKGLSETFYNEIIKICQKNQTSFIIDTNSKELLEALAARPFLVKPNQSELGDLFGKTIQTKEEAIDYGKKLQKAGAQNVIVSLGGEGAIFIDDDQVIMADSPKGKVKNTVGSGDSMIAGFLAGIQKGNQR